MEGNKMELNKKQLDLLREAGVKVPHGAKDDSFLTAEDEELLSDLLMNSLAPGQEWTAKAQEIQDLLTYLAEEG
jgi:hypothetical protein